MGRGILLLRTRDKGEVDQLSGAGKKSRRMIPGKKPARVAKEQGESLLNCDN